jgi:hypothetical protein
MGTRGLCPINRGSVRSAEWLTFREILEGKFSCQHIGPPFVAGKHGSLNFFASNVIEY